MDVVTYRRRRLSRMEKVADCESLLIEILIRLHCREAVKSKLVCKRWNSIISSDYFVTVFNHRRHDPSLPPIPYDPSYKLIYQYIYRYPFVFRRHEYSSIVHCGSNSKPFMERNLDLSFLPCREKSRIDVVASCADLILCAFTENPDLSHFTHYFVCNVQTKQWFALPPARNLENNSDYAIGFFCIPSPCSLCRSQEHECVDNSRYKFMVLRVHRGLVPSPNITLSEVELFWSEEGEWTRREVSPPLMLRRRHDGNMVPYRGMLHWLNYPHVVVFDQYGRISRVIDINKFDGYRYSDRICSFDVYQDRLRMVYTCLSGYRDRCCHYYIWELEDYDRGTWSIVKMVVFRELGEGYVHPDGNAAYCTYDLVDCNHCIWFCNMLSQVSDHKFKLVVRYQGSKNVVTVKNAYRVTDQCWPTPVPSLGM